MSVVTVFPCTSGVPREIRYFEPLAHTQAGLKYIRKTLAQGDTHLDVVEFYSLFFFSALAYIDLTLTQPNPTLNPLTLILYAELHISKDQITHRRLTFSQCPSQFHFPSPNSRRCYHRRRRHNCSRIRNPNPILIHSLPSRHPKCNLLSAIQNRMLRPIPPLLVAWISSTAWGPLKHPSMILPLIWNLPLPLSPRFIQKSTPLPAPHRTCTLLQCKSKSFLSKTSKCTRLLPWRPACLALPVALAIASAGIFQRRFLVLLAIQQ